MLEHQQRLATLIHKHLTVHPLTLTKVYTGIINTNTDCKHMFR